MVKGRDGKYRKPENHNRKFPNDPVPDDGPLTESDETDVSDTAHLPHLPGTTGSVGSITEAPDYPVPNGVAVALTVRRAELLMTVKYPLPEDQQRGLVQVIGEMIRDAEKGRQENSDLRAKIQAIKTRYYEMESQRSALKSVIDTPASQLAEDMDDESI